MAKLSLEDLKKALAGIINTIKPIAAKIKPLCEKALAKLKELKNKNAATQTENSAAKPTTDQSAKPKDENPQGPSA